jgi:hypothetical protein
MSYAHTALPGKEVIRFFNDLSENVAQLVSLPTGSEPGFMDKSMQGGELWTKELLRAVGTCQVFVALMSDPYVRSEWCSREWFAFSRRNVTSASRDVIPHRTGMIPVWWTPVPMNRLPDAVTRVQFFSPRAMPGENITARYESDGVYGLMRQRKDALYKGVVWHLAQSIAKFHFSCAVESRILHERELHDIFREAAS